MDKVFLLLGSNLGDRLQIINQAIRLISVKIGRISLVSSFFESEAWGFISEHNFLNMVLQIETFLKPESLLVEILEIEKELGRLRSNGTTYQSRSIDIDILFYNNLKYSTDLLTIPHPKITERKFALTPLCQIAPDFIHPVNFCSIKQLLDVCNDTSNVRLYNPVNQS